MTEKTFHVWGPVGAGKTVYLAMLGSHPSFKLKVEAVDNDEETREFVELARDTLIYKEQFMAATHPDSFDADNRERRLSFAVRQNEELLGKLTVFDRAGGRYEQIDDELADEIADSDGLLMLTEVAPLNPRKNLTALMSTLSSLSQKLETRPKKGRPTFPIAFCITKIDRNLSQQNEVDEMRRDPDSYVKVNAEALNLGDMIRQLSDWGTVSCFPVSSIGVKTHRGMATSACYLDQLLELRARLTNGVEPVNLYEPLEWLFGVQSP